LLAHSAHQISFCDSAHESLCGPQHDPQRPHVLSTNTQSYAHGFSGIIFNTTYADFEHLHDIDLRGMQWLTRAKGATTCRTKCPPDFAGNPSKTSTRPFDLPRLAQLL